MFCVSYEVKGNKNDTLLQADFMMQENAKTFIFMRPCTRTGRKDVLKQGPALYKEPWTGRAVSHFTLDTELSTSPGHAIRLEAGNSNLLR